jgi:hypothetical protein
MNSKFYSIIALLLILAQVTVAQVTEQEANLLNKKTDTVPGWKKGGVLALTIAQTSLTNWAAGGQNSFAINGLVSLFANYKQGKSAWDNSLDIGYGLLRQGKETDFMKTDDKIDLLSKYGYRAHKNLYYSALINFKTQMADGLDYNSDTSKISGFLAPAYLTIAAGMDYKPNANFSAFVAPLTGKITLINDQTLADAGAYGVDPATYDGSGNLLEHGSKNKSEFGGYVRMIYSKNDFKTEILKNLAFTTKIDLFSNYLKNPQNIDVSWETQLALKINKFLSMNINTHLIYDDDVNIAIDNNEDGIIDEKGPRIQFKEIVGVGISYKF